MIKRRLAALRQVMKQEGLSAYIISGTDPHQSEYVCKRWRTRAWISGFTGSAGTVVVTMDRAGLWVDSRYYLQAEEQLKGSGIELFRLGLPHVNDYPLWLIDQLAENVRVGMAAEEVSVSQTAKMQRSLDSHHIQFIPTKDLLDRVWEGRPVLPEGEIHALPIDMTGVSRVEKLTMVQKAISRLGADSTVISSLDDIAWLMNLRGGDIAFNPLFLSFVCVTKASVSLFCDREKITDIEALHALEQDVQIFPYASVYSELPKLLSKSTAVYFSPEKINMRLSSVFPEHIIRVQGRNVTTDMKSVKNPVEISGIKEAHRIDGAALVSFFQWLEEVWDPETNPLNEYTFGQKLLSYRKAAKSFLGESFSPIVGFKDHGASCHYSAAPESAYPITGDGLMVLDTGGQYQGGTTDITRTLLFGEPTEEQIEDYTLVLKGHLAVKRQLFPEGTCGYQIDSIARMALWNKGLNYGHGTGHGVGHMLNVHEGPQSISPKPITVPLIPGMVISNEPGLYRSKRHGVRIENLVVVERRDTGEFGQFYGFENLTLCPYERRLIDTSLLTEQEKMQVDAYHAMAYDELKDRLSLEASRWLKQKTQPLP